MMILVKCGYLDNNLTFEVTEISMSFPRGILDVFRCQIDVTSKLHAWRNTGSLFYFVLR